MYVAQTEEQATRIFCRRLSNSEKLSAFASSKPSTEGIEKYGIKRINEGGGGGGSLRISSDRDDRMGTKNPNPKKSLGLPAKPKQIP